MTPLIAVEHLRALIEARSPVAVLDVRWTLAGPERDAYAEGHIPGAHFVSVDDDLAAPHGQRSVHGRHPLPDAADFQTVMRRCGVDAAHPVVVYDAQGGTSAARAWWLLRYFGHDDVRLLDGGYPAWVAEGEPVSTALPPRGNGDFVARPGRMPLLDAAGAAALARDGLLVDARAAERYAGEREAVDPVAGHIPGAVNVPTTEHVGADGRMVAHDQLLARFEKVGYAGGPVGAYCGSGVSAAHTVLALEVAGVHGAGLYADSWSGWI
ncbi:MAG: sulfurtransferase, partial [Actinomycetota bacterium]|nr:sulfurtransferase [Actinomycetota bacterium]